MPADAVATLGASASADMVLSIKTRRFCLPASGEWKHKAICNLKEFLAMVLE